MNETDITFTMNERSVRALHSAVVFTLDKWAGQGVMDQECLIGMRSSLQGCLFEFTLDKTVE